MSTYLKGKANLFNLFSIFDFYLSTSPPIRPIFELSFMPRDLAYDTAKTIMHYQGITSTFAEDKAGAWAAFITEMFVQLELRYGAEEVRSWRVEVSLAHPRQKSSARPNILTQTHRRNRPNTTHPRY